MRENEFAILLQSALTQFVKNRIPGGGADVEFSQNFQPTQQARPEGKAVYFKRLFGKRYGWPGVAYDFVPDRDNFDRSEAQIVETRYQFSVTTPADTDPAAITHFDILEGVASGLQSPRFLAYLKAAGAQVLRIVDMNNVPFKNDQDQFEDYPTFDAIFLYVNEYVDEVEKLTATEAKIYPV